ncbi:MAG TPA: hypothetical protein VH300_00605 [Thermoleophilaceae bacterium]|nr:hypothetical protein [Thermoleophilaceae bacterium]
MGRVRVEPLTERYHVQRLAPADWVTLARATLAVGVAALVADSFEVPVPLALLLPLVSVTLALDAVDGWTARRTRTTGLFADFDGEVDAFLILVLSVYVARSAGAWVLAIGAARYAFLAAGWVLPWMREPLPPRYWRKVVAATQGIVLAIAAAHVLPSSVTRPALVAALMLLGESFGRDTLWLWRRRPKARARKPVGGRAGAALTALAVLLVWVGLVAPHQPAHVTLGSFVRLPLEGLVLVALAVLLPPRARRLLPAVVGPLLALVLILKLLDIGFFVTFDRPFDPYRDLNYAGIGAETLRASIGTTQANLVIAAVLLFVAGLLVFMTLALRRLSRTVTRDRRGSLRAVTALALVWLLCWVFGARLVSHAPFASASAAGVVADKVSEYVSDINDPATFAREITNDRLRDTPGSRLLTGLRGKDVLLVFVESYGQVAVQGSSFSPQVDAVLANGTKQLQAAGFSARSGFLKSPTFGGTSWLAHSTMQSGVWVNTLQRSGQLVKSNRFTLSDAFKRAGWRTVDDSPSNDREWDPGSSFYHYDKIYDRRNVGYRGPTFAYASMPDQYVLSALQRLELATPRKRKPVFAEVDLVSSHEPWTRIPRMVPWQRLRDGSIFNNMPVEHTSRDVSNKPAFSWLTGGAAAVRAAYAQSIDYSLNALISFVRTYRDPNLVMVVLGDHQPWAIVSGAAPNHNVPTSIVAHDPAVLKRIAGWGWNPGLRPRPHAPVWPMSAFRDRFLTAFGPRPASSSSP